MKEFEDILEEISHNLEWCDDAYQSRCYRRSHDEITRLRAELAAALDAAATEKTLREHETKRANDNYASLTKHWLNESKLRELLTEIVEYNGGAGHALADEYVVARIDAALGGGDE